MASIVTSMFFFLFLSSPDELSESDLNNTKERKNITEGQEQDSSFFHDTLNMKALWMHRLVNKLIR